MRGGRVLAAVFLLSAAAVGFEIILMRLLSIVQWHGYAPVVISLALLGYGAGGTFLGLTQERLRRNFDASLAALAALFGISAPLVAAAAERLPFNPLELAWDPRQWLLLGASHLVLAVPFFFTAAAVGLALAHRRAVGTTYLADLTGAASGSIAALLLLFVLPAWRIVPIVGGAGLAAAALALPHRAGRLPGWRSAGLAAAGLAVAGLAVAELLPGTLLRPEPSPYKGLSQALRAPGARIESESSGPLGWLTVVRSPAIPFRHAPGLSLRCPEPIPEQAGIFSDGEAMTAADEVTEGSGGDAYLDCTLGALPYLLVPRPRVLVVGLGGGADVRLALRRGAPSVVVAEVDGRRTGLFTGPLRNLSGDLLGRPGVRVEAAEPRAWLRQPGETYDLLRLDLSDSAALAAAGGLTGRESYLLTVEAFEAMLDRLAPGGMMAVTTRMRLPPVEALKLLGTAAEALGRLGARHPGSHLAVVRDFRTVLVLAARDPLDGGRLAAIRGFAERWWFDLGWLPGMTRDEADRHNRLDRPQLFDGAAALLGGDAGRFRRGYKFDLTPATDGRPYFNRFFRWRSLPELWSLRRTGGAALLEWGYLIWWAVLLEASLAGVLLILLPLLALRRRTVPGGTRRGAYFTFLGLGFMLVEVGTMQRLGLWLGNPIYSAAAALAGFLLFAGLGAGFSRRLSEGSGQPGGIRWACLSVAGAAAVSLPAVPLLLAPLASRADPVRIAAAVLLLAPAAFLMGLPFPLGLSRVREAAPGWVPWAWGINGWASVVGAVLAGIVALHLGTGAVVAGGAACYLLAGAVGVGDEAKRS